MKTPEAFWRARGPDVIGLDVLREGSQARQAATYSMIAEWIVSRGVYDVLDVGCNVAALAQFLQNSGFQGRYLGVDTNRHALKLAIAPAQWGNLRKLAFPDKAFACVVVKDVIEHLENPEPLREAFRVADPYAIVATYLPWQQRAITEVHPDGYYINRYSWRAMKRLAHDCGFELIERQEVMEKDGCPNLVTVWERKR